MPTGPRRVYGRNTKLDIGCGGNEDVEMNGGITKQDRIRNEINNRGTPEEGKISNPINCMKRFKW